jgi:ATP-dependent exoDNAse (exonuclease V) alpha subunit
VYIAVSRARQQLYLPYDVVEWIDYHHSREPKFRESHGY